MPHAAAGSCAPFLFPALGVRRYALRNLDDERKVEILDIPYGFAARTAREAGAPWQQELQDRVGREKSCIQAFAGHENEDGASFAELIAEVL